MSANEEPLFSRSGETSPYGKCDEALEVAFPKKVKADLAMVATAKGMGSSEYVRLLVTRQLYGAAGEVRAIVNRLDE